MLLYDLHFKLTTHLLAANLNFCKVKEENKNEY